MRKIDDTGSAGMGNDTERRIADIARRQHGLITRVQLLELGLRAGSIRRRASAGRIVTIHRGVYRVGLIAATREAEVAAILACGPGAVLSHRSAAVVWRLIAPRNGAPIDVAVPLGRDARRRGIRVRRVAELGPDERTVLDGIPTTTPARTLVDLAAVAGKREMEQALAVADREGLVRRKDLDALVARHRGRVGIRTIRRALDADGGPALTRSEAEVRFLALIRQARLPAPETNAAVGDHEVDFLWRDERIAVEVDGYRYHSSRTRFEADRRRSARLAGAGIHVIPLSWRQIVEDGVATVVRLGQALVHAKLRNDGR